MSSEFAWRLADYEAAGAEAPGRCISNPDLSEGEMMTAEEVQEYIKDSIATLRILADKQSARYDEIVAMYLEDLAYLSQVGQIDEDDYNELTHSSNLKFNAEI
jgi:hypothetical protein